MKLLGIAVGGAIGSLLRYLLAGWIQRVLGDLLPWGTLVVNVLGSFLLGFLAALLRGPVLVREEVRLFLLVGLLGGFTTFSTFSFETLRLAQAGQFLAATLNVVASVVLGLLAAWMGLRLSEAWFGP